MWAGEIRLVLGPKPNPAWGAAADRPPSMSAPARP
jgi:hypothetical protein